MSSNGQWFNNALNPFLAADAASVTLAATYKALLPAQQLPVLGPHFFGFVGKKVRVEMFGRITTVLTPGNVQLALFYGTGADANGVNLAASTAQALIASQTNISWRCQFDITCRSIGSVGSLFVTGLANFGESVSVAHILIPGSAPVVSAAVDLTSATLLLSPQILRSGSTAETAIIHEFTVSELN